MNTVTISIERFKELEAKEMIADKIKPVYMHYSGLLGRSAYYPLSYDEMIKEMKDDNNRLSKLLSEYKSKNTWQKIKDIFNGE